jgi:hypothetical protein
MRDLGQRYWGSIIEKIPDNIRKEMNHGHRKVFETIYECTRRHSAARPSKAMYTTPSLLYIASKAFLRVETVSRRIQDLQKWGLIKITHRRQVAGRWQTNLYRLGHMVLLALGWLKSWIHSFHSHLTLGSNIVTTIERKQSLKGKETVNNRSPDNCDYQATLERLKIAAQKIGRWESPTT